MPSRLPLTRRGFLGAFAESAPPAIAALPALCAEARPFSIAERLARLEPEAPIAKGQ
jgi:hypothetical protein